MGENLYGPDAFENDPSFEQVIAQNEKKILNLFNAEKKEKAIAAVADLCLQCGDKHSEECPVAKAISAVKDIPTA